MCYLADREVEVILSGTFFCSDQDSMLHCVMTSLMGIKQMSCRQQLPDFRAIVAGRWKREKSLIRVNKMDQATYPWLKEF